MIDTASNKSKIALIVIGYNRLTSLIRLLNSLQQASYPTNDVPLVISIDCSGNEQLYDFVRQFQWKHGDKYVIIQNIRLGLKEHIFQCAGLSKHFKAIVLLEDDLFVSPFFYNYINLSVDQYGYDDNIAGIALYTNEYNGYVNLPYRILQNGSDVVAMQSTCTWGECFTEKMWNNFRTWLQDWDQDFESVDMPEIIKNWDRAWSKYYDAYLVLNNKYFIYPHISVATNFGDAGEHSNVSVTCTQVNLLLGNKKYNFFDFKKLVKYDSFTNNIDIYKWLGLSEEELCLDLWGNRINFKKKRYILSPYLLPFQAINHFGLQLRPHELNIKYKIDGNELHLYDTFFPISPERTTNTLKLNNISYHLNGFGYNYLDAVTKHRIINSFKRRLNLHKVADLLRKIEMVYWNHKTDFISKYWKFRSKNSAVNGKILMYHHITDKIVNSPPCCVCKTDVFKQTLIELKNKGYKFVSLDEAMNIIKENSDEKFIVITFDDVPDDMFINAYPFLKEMNIPFTIYVTTAFINKAGFINEEQLKTLNLDPLCTIGSHTITHPFLKTCENAWGEIKNSKIILEQRLKKPVDHFAYPYGKPFVVSSKNIRMAKKAGYKTAVSTIDSDISSFTGKKRWFLPRVIIN